MKPCVGCDCMRWEVGIKGYWLQLRGRVSEGRRGIILAKEFVERHLVPSLAGLLTQKLEQNSEAV